MKLFIDEIWSSQRVALAVHVFVACESKSLREALETVTILIHWEFELNGRSRTLFGGIPSQTSQLFDNISKVPDVYTVCFTLKKYVGKIGSSADWKCSTGRKSVVTVMCLYPFSSATYLFLKRCVSILTWLFLLCKAPKARNGGPYVAASLCIVCTLDYQYTTGLQYYYQNNSIPIC